MQLSDKSLTILKNFANINSSMLFRKGKIQTASEEDDHQVVSAELEEFPKEFGIYDLNQFLANITTLTNPNLTFEDNYVSISDGKINLKYFYCEKALIKTIDPDEFKDMDIESPDVKFILEQETYSKIVKLAGMNDLPVISFVGKDGKLSCVAENLNGKNSPSADFDVSDYTGKDFKASFNLQFLNILPRNYEVKIKSGEYGTFTASDIAYHIATEIQPKGMK